MNTAFRAVSLLSFSLVCTSIAAAQATPAATQPIHLSAFGGITGSYTGLYNSRNAGITAGFDVGFKPFYRLYPSAEIRGTYPIDSGALAGERTVFYGIKIERPYRERFHPYGDVFAGRNEIKYQSGGLPNANGTLLYVQSISNALAVGGGVDIDFTPHFALKLDGQFQRLDTPVTASGEIYAKAYTAGVVYRIDFNHHFHYDKTTGQVTNLPKDRTPPPPRIPPTPAPDSAPATPAPAPTPPTPAPQR